MMLVQKHKFAKVCHRFLKNDTFLPAIRNIRYCSDTKTPKKTDIPRIEYKKIFNQPPLNEVFPGLPTVFYEPSKVNQQFTRITKLHNGLRIATENRFGHFSTIGVIINAGPRYEVSYPSGVSHFLEKISFQSTKKYESKLAILKELENYGGIGDAQITRDVAIYAASCMSHGIDPVMSIISDMVLRPNLTFDEIEATRQTINYELESNRTKPEQDVILMDMIHAAAYKDNTLGLPKLCPEKNLKTIDKSILTTFQRYHYSPERMVVTGIGVDHDEFVNIVKKYFLDEEPIWMSQPELIKTETQYYPDRSVAQYTGGVVLDKCELPQYNVSGLPELAHVVIGLEGVSYNDSDYIPLCVLNTLMGGGSSFSAGGPGKGMFSRLYINVLNKHRFVSGATCYNQSYQDSGLFFIHGCSTPENLGQTTEVIIKELVNMTSNFYVGELERAKKQLQSMLLMNLETKPVVFEDTARQVLANGFRKRPENYMNLIERVNYDDLKRVSDRILQSPVSVAARGDISALPTYEEIQSGISSTFLSSKMVSNKSA